MVSETQKRKFVTSFKTDLTTIIQTIRHAETAIKIYLAKNFGPGQADEITDAHLEIIGTTVADLIEGKMLVDNLIKFVVNQEPNQTDYEKIFNKLRNDYGL